ADLVLEITLGLVWSQLSRKHRDVPRFAVIAYGKLGGKELGYGSDLDIIFLYDPAAAREPPEKLARIAQRMVTWLTSHTAAGVLYDADLRLRPDGASGLMVSSLESFRDYQAKRAWTWEHQALTRARFSAGDAALGRRFEAARDEILATPRDRARLFEEIQAMRRKMRAENRSEAQELKQIEGGIIDLEFAVQALVLAEGPAHPGLRENKGNHTLLHRAGDLGLVDRTIASDAAGAYLAMRKRTHEAARLADELRARGHQVSVEPLMSGAGYIRRAGNGWIGAADPRRGGNASGE
ncbi:MAG TPA: bifunctional glutamine synthetase adenylyltransferase/deadenyltransferase, partial [Usitatibacter sp.]